MEEFARFLKLPVSAALLELFALFDRVRGLPFSTSSNGKRGREGHLTGVCPHVCDQDGDGTIDFREYVIGVTILCRPANTEEVLRMAFKVGGDQCRSSNTFCVAYFPH